MSLGLAAVAEQDVACSVAKHLGNPVPVHNAFGKLRRALLVTDDDGLVRKGKVGFRDPA